MGFGGVLWVLPAAAGRKCPAVGIGGRRGITDCHSQCAHWLRNDTFFCKGHSGQRAAGYIGPALQGGLRGRMFYHFTTRKSTPVGVLFLLYQLSFSLESLSRWMAP